MPLSALISSFLSGHFIAAVIDGRYFSEPIHLLFCVFHHIVFVVVIACLYYPMLVVTVCVCTVSSGGDTQVSVYYITWWQDHRSGGR